MIRWEPWICDMYWPPRTISKKHNVLMGNNYLCSQVSNLGNVCHSTNKFTKTGLDLLSALFGALFDRFYSQRERHLLINVSWSMQNSNMSFSPVWREWNGNLTISGQLKANKNVHVEQAFATFPSNLQLSCKGVMHLWRSQNMSNFQSNLIPINSSKFQVNIV